MKKGVREMAKRLEIYKCSECGNIVEVLNGAGGVVAILTLVINCAGSSSLGG